MLILTISSQGHNTVEYFTVQINTFQGAIITDTIQSYYVFSFTCGAIEWSGQGPETAVVGYNSNGEFFLNHPANGFPDIGRIVSCTKYLIPEGEQEILGAPSGKCPADAAMQDEKQLCRDTAQADDGSFVDIDELEDSNMQTWRTLSQCPPTRAHLQISTEFEPFPLQTGDCYRSRNTFVPSLSSNSLLRPYEFVSVCCYDTIG